MNHTKGTTCVILALTAIAFAGLALVYAQTAADVDFDGDGQVGFGDFLSFAGKFGTSQGDGRYEAKYDLDGDGQVGFSDFLAFARFFGQSSVPNDPPLLERIGDQGVPIGVPLTIELAASDPDGDDLTYRVNGNPAGSTFSGTTFRWTPTSGEGSTRRVTFTVNDGRGGTDSETIAIRVVEFRFRLVVHRITTEAPSFVNILFQVLDFDNWGVTSLATEHFEVREGDQVVSPTESAMRVQKRKAIPHRFKLKTVLMLDTSPSVEQHLEQIKQAAIILVENMTENQEIALYEFSEEPVLLQDFTNDAAALTKAIREIRLGFPTTNLYGSIIAGTARWEDIFTTTEVQQGFLVILTDGSDTQGSYTLSEALSARGNKNIYTIGLGNEIDPDVLKELGNAGFFQIVDVSKLAEQLAERFIEIQKRIVSFADSFYWLRYLSTKRGDREHRLVLRVKGNQHNFMLYGEFNSRTFYSVRHGVFVNASRSNSEGIEELRMAKGDTARLQAVTYLGTESPQYRWESSDSDIVAIKPDPADASVAWAIAVGDSGKVTLRVFDEVNELERQVDVKVLLTEVFINPSRSNPKGIEELRIAEGDAVRLKAVTYPWIESPQYRWESSDSDIVAIKPDSVDASVAWAIAVGDSGQTATLRVFDQGNRLKRQVDVEVIPPTFITLPEGALLTLPGGVSLEMVKIAPGTFQMGSPPSEEGRTSHEGPVHAVTISQGFYLGKYEVTQAQWEAVMGSNPSVFKGCGDCPVEQVSWHHAQAFIRKLNEMEGENVYRLPSEAEWEYAARAGATTRYSWGDEIGSNRANCYGCSSQWDNKKTAPVGSFSANTWGLHDMHGNVFEWVQDCWNDSYRGAPTDGSAGGSGNCEDRVLRGGAWGGIPRLLRAAFRIGVSSGLRDNSIGFRVARTVSP